MEKEEEVMEFWKKNRIYEKVKARCKGKQKFYFLDGPPYATGSIHIGTAMNKILKDVYIRFFRMLGYNVNDQPGFDCHGLPIENKVEKELGFKSKKDIEAFGVENFIKECKKFATKHITTMSEQFANLGVWMDWSNPYLTLKNEYIEGAWYTFKKAYERGLLYKGVYPVHVCPRCETAVAYNEIVYKEVEDIAIFVKFKVLGKENEYLVIWTTTPWTLPGNVAIMAHPEIEYAKVKVGGEILIIAKNLVEATMRKAGIEEYEIIEVISGKKLEGTKYEHPLGDLLPYSKKYKEIYRVILNSQFVSETEGTGLVHAAPGHGQEDYKACREYELPVICPVAMNGVFKEIEFLRGKKVEDANEAIIKELERRGALLAIEKIRHDYPFCWRCDSKLLLLACEQWFFAVTRMRDLLLRENEQIVWSPSWAKKRFENWLRSLGDWPISRQRYWGIPLPIWRCENCDEILVIGSIEEIKQHGGEVPRDLHKPHIDKVLLTCPKCGKKMRRVSDVLDVWFDSGVAPWASLGYPREKEKFSKLYPVDLVIEGPDQIRGWWNSMLLTSVMTFGKRSFNRVLMHGFVLDAHGVKMSKSKGNIVTPEEVIARYSRDTLRAFFLASPPWEDYYFKWEEVEKVNRYLNIIRNVYKYVATYVESPVKEIEAIESSLEIEDEWILSRLNSTLRTCEEEMKKLRPHLAFRCLLDFAVEDLSRWYIKLVRDRVKGLRGEASKLAAHSTLLKVCEVLCRALAPFVPFLAEICYWRISNLLKDREESVHLCEWPGYEEEKIDRELEQGMEIVREIFKVCCNLRQRAGLRLRFPLGELALCLKSEAKESVERLKEVVKRCCNCMKLNFLESANEIPGDYERQEFFAGIVAIPRELDESSIKLAFIRELARAVQVERKRLKLKVNELVRLKLDCDEWCKKAISERENEFKLRIGAKELVFAPIEKDFVSVKIFEREIKLRIERD